MINFREKMEELKHFAERCIECCFKRGIKHCLKCCVENGWVRAVVLFLALVLGYCLVILLGGWFACVLGVTNSNIHYARLPLLTLPLLFVLWIFRTYDTRQQIEKSQQQIEKSQQQIEQSQAQTQQSQFANGLDNLLSENSFHISMGVQLLIHLSNKTNGEFDSEIRLAFIKRFQHLPDDIRDHEGTEVYDKSKISISWPTLNYIPHMLRWIIDHAEKNKKNLDEESIDVPEMYFQIEYLECTKNFTDKYLAVFSKKIPLGDIKTALSKCQIPTVEDVGELLLNSGEGEDATHTRDE